MADGRNVYAAILAGGSGTRMGNPEKPKQFLMLGDKPILAHTVEKFCAGNYFEKVVVLCPESWVQKTNDLLRRYCPEFCESVSVIAGGSSRNATIRNAIAHLCEKMKIAFWLLMMRFGLSCRIGLLRIIFNPLPSMVLAIR